VLIIAHIISYDLVFQESFNDVFKSSSELIGLFLL
jgi:hypothetical protein